VAQTLVINGVSYAYPETADTDWGDVATSWAAAVSTSLLQKTGGTFTLSAEVDFGASFGLKSTYYKSRATFPSTTGQIRLGTTEVIAWRNNANSGNNTLATDSSDNLLYNGVNFAGTIPINRGGTGQTTANAGFNALSPMTTLGDIIYGAASGAGTRLAGNTTTTKLFLTQTGTGAVSAIPAWAAILAADISGLTNSNLSGSAGITGANIANTTIATGNMVNNAITNAKMAQMATLTIKGNNTGGTADPLDLTIAETQSILFPVTAKSADYTLTSADWLIAYTASGGTRTGTLPTAVGISGKQFGMSRIDNTIANTVNFATTSAQTIDGSSVMPKLYLPGDYQIVASTGTNWITVSKFFTKVTARYTRSTAQNIANGTITTMIYPTNVFDTHNSYNTGTGVFTCKRAGKYQFGAIVTFASSGAWAATEEAFISLKVNSTTVMRMVDNYAQATFTFFLSLNGVGTVELTAGDTVEIQVFQSSGAALDTHNDANLNHFFVNEIL